MTTYNWTINNLERFTSNGVVYGVHFSVSAEDGTYSANVNGSIGLDIEDVSTRETFIPFKDLTREVVEGWVKDKMGEEQVSQVETNLQEQLNEQSSPTRASGVPVSWEVK